MDTLTSATPGMESIREHLQIHNQTRILYTQSVATFLFPVLAASWLALIIRRLADPVLLYGWLALIVIHALYRYRLLWRYFHAGSAAHQAAPWMNRFLRAVIVSGLAWGAAGMLLIPLQGPDRLLFTLYNGLVILTVCGLVAGAVISYAVSFWVLFSYATPALLPPAFYLISIGDRYNSALGGLVLLYYLFITVAAWRMNRQFRYFLNMEYRQRKLQRQYENLQQTFQDYRRKARRRSGGTG